MYTRVKAKCLNCTLHFVVCTFRPDRHSADTLYCPECGQHNGSFMVWRESADGFIFQEVPGGAPPDDRVRNTPAANQVGTRRWWRFW